VGDSQVGDIFFVSLKWPKGLRHLIYFFKLLRLGRKSDVILAADSSFGAATIAAIASWFLRKKFIVRVTGDYAWEQGMQRFGVKDLIDEFQTKKYGWRVQFLRICQKLVVKNAVTVIAPSEYLKKIVVGWGVPPEKVGVIYNGTDIHQGSPSINSGTNILFPERSEAESKGYTIISAGRLVPWKGFEVLIEAVAELRQEIPEIKLVIIGSGPDEQKLKVLSSKLEVNGNIIFKGSLSKEDLASQIKSADIFILNTAYEGFSHQIIEAMAMGVPVVTTNVGGNPEIIKDGENGLLVGYNDREAIKAAILKLYKDRELGARLGRNGAESAEQYSVEAMLDNLTKVL